MPEPAITLDDVLDVQRLTAADTTRAYRAIDALAQRLFQRVLFTVTRSLHETSEVERVYSSDPAAYPVGGRKAKAGTEWGAAVLERGEPLFCNGPAAIRRVFADHDIILGLGVAAMVNVPVLLGGRSVATMNLCRADPLADADLPALQTLAALLLPLVLAGAAASADPEPVP